MDCFKGKLKPENPMIFMGKSMVSGEDFPKQTNPLICWFMFFLYLVAHPTNRKWVSSPQL